MAYVTVPKDLTKVKSKAKPKKKQKLSRKQKKEINNLVSSYKGDDKAHSAQDSIPYERMYEDGLCKLTKTKYSRCIELGDDNYYRAFPLEERMMNDENSRAI